jgi:GLPGLI family protein
MRNYFLLTAFILTNSCFAQFINLKYIAIEPAHTVVIYKLKYQQDSTDATNIRSSTLVLFIGNTVSKFVNKANYINDTAVRKFTSNKQALDYLTDPTAPRGGGQLYQIYKNYPKGKMTFTDHIPSDTYKFEEELDLFNWILLDDTSTVCGYKAQKAICNFGGRNWIAWFSPGLPFNDGPYKFNGLPGLIVKIYDTRNHYVFELNSINKLAPGVMIEMQDKEYIKTTKQGFFRAEDYFREDIINRAKEAGMDSSAQQVMAKNAAVRNNPIELKRK